MTEWRKHDTNFFRNAKVFEMATEGGPLALLLAILILDLNAVGDRRGRLHAKESRPQFLAAQLAGSGLDEVSPAAVSSLLDVLAKAGFIEIGSDGRLHLPGWSDDEFGIRGRGPKPGGIRKCDHCGEAFTPQRNNHRFCSANCRKRASESPPDASQDASDGRLGGRLDGRLDGSDGEIEGEIDRGREGRKEASVRLRPSDEADGTRGSLAPPEDDSEDEESVDDLMARYRTLFQADGGAA